MNVHTRRYIFGALLSLLLTPLICYAQEQASDSSRQIVLEEFARTRPAPTTAILPKRKVTGKRASGASMKASLNLAKYRRVTKSLSHSVETTRYSDTELGVTIWRLRRSRPDDDPGARFLIIEKNEKTQWTPERIEADSPLRVGDRVRLSIEAPRNGYLYVIDREQYQDGSMGDALLIFPTTRTNGGDNHVRPGRLVDIPAQEDDPNYFTLVPSPSRKDQVGETLSIILTAQPLDELPVTANPLRIEPEELRRWERLWAVAFEKFEMVGGMGMAWTKEEREAAAVKSSRTLTQEEPTPQTIYRLESAPKNSILVTLRLNYRNK